MMASTMTGTTKQLVASCLSSKLHLYADFGSAGTPEGLPRQCLLVSNDTNHHSTPLDATTCQCRLMLFETNHHSTVSASLQQLSLVLPSLACGALCTNIHPNCNSVSHSVSTGICVRTKSVESSVRLPSTSFGAN